MTAVVPRHIVVLCHPEQHSFNAAMASAYCADVRQHGHDVLVRDLYAMGFDPVLKSVERAGPDLRSMPDVRDEQAVIAGADVFVLVYPIWFGGPPAMLKGYLERVLGMGAMPARLPNHAATGVLTGKRLLSFTSSATDSEWLATQGQLDALITGFDRYIEHGFAMQKSDHVHFGAVTADLDPSVFDRHRQQVQAQARSTCAAIDEMALHRIAAG